MMWRVEFESGESLTTADAKLVELHRQKGRFIVELRGAPDASDDSEVKLDE